MDNESDHTNVKCRITVLRRHKSISTTRKTNETVTHYISIQRCLQL